MSFAQESIGQSSQIGVGEVRCRREWPCISPSRNWAGKGSCLDFLDHRLASQQGDDHEYKNIAAQGPGHAVCQRIRPGIKQQSLRAQPGITE